MARKLPQLPDGARKEARASGAALPAPDYRPSPPPKRKKRAPWKTHKVLVIAGLWLLFAGGVVLSYWFSQLPDTNNLLAYDPGKDVTLLDVKSRMIARRGITQGQQVKLGELPPYVGNAFIAVEDRRFRYHYGIDPLGLARAAYADLVQRAYVQGGSTLTQQLAKNLFLKPERTINRKIEEAILAVYLETRYSKDEILTLYLNRVYFGAGVYGIEAASERFFGKPAHDLSLTEAAMLAGSVKAPSRYNPEAAPDAAKGRASLVLAAMEEANFINHATRLAAASTQPKIAHSFATPGAGYFVDYTMSQVSNFVADAKERLIVETTLDLDLQRAAEKALTAGLDKDGSKLKATQGALVAMSLDGALRALVGGRSYDDSPFNRATEAERQPGSAFKAFVYLAALEHGHNPADFVFDGPVSIGNWQPGNYEGAYEGDITLAHALAHSSNSASVQLTNEAGPETVVRVAHRLGVSHALHPVPSLALGTSEVTPLELTTGYAPFANGGAAVMPYGIVRIKTISGKVLYRRREPELGRVMSLQHNADMTAMMTGTVMEGTGKAAALNQRPVAGKTGTSQDYRDAWFVGFSADYVTSVWIGNDNGGPMKKATGGGLPARIFKAFMTDAERGLPVRPLVGTTLFAAEEAIPAEQPPPEESRERARRDRNDLLGAFEDLLDSLF